MITGAVLEQARNDLEDRAAALHGVQFENVVRLIFSFKEIRAGFDRGTISKQITYYSAKDTVLQPFTGLA